MIRNMTVRADELIGDDLAALAGVVVKIRQPVLSTRTVQITWPPQGMVESGRVTLSLATPVAIQRETNPV